MKVPKIKGKPLPVVVYPVTIVAVLAFLGWLAWREIRIEITGPGHTAAEFAPGGTALYVALGAVLVGVIASVAVVRRARSSGGGSGGVTSSPPEG